MRPIQFGAVTLFVQTEAEANNRKSKEINRRFDEAVAGFKRNHNLSDDDVLEVPLDKRGPGYQYGLCRLLVDREDLGRFGRDLILKERLVQKNLQAQLKTVSGAFKAIVGSTTDQEMYGSRYKQLEQLVAHDYANKAGTKVLDLDA